MPIRYDSAKKKWMMGSKYFKTKEKAMRAYRAYLAKQKGKK